MSNGKDLVVCHFPTPNGLEVKQGSNAERMLCEIRFWLTPGLGGMVDGVHNTDAFLNDLVQAAFRMWGTNDRLRIENRTLRDEIDALRRAVG